MKNKLIYEFRVDDTPPGRATAEKLLAILQEGINVRITTEEGERRYSIYEPTEERRWAVFTNDNSSLCEHGDIDMEDYAKWLTEHMRQAHSKKLGWEDLIGLYAAWSQSSKFTPADKDPLYEEEGDGLDDPIEVDYTFSVRDLPRHSMTDPFLIYKGVLVNYEWKDKRIFGFLDYGVDPALLPNLVAVYLRKGHLDLLWKSHIPKGFENHGGIGVSGPDGDGWDITSRTVRDVRKLGW